MHIRNLETKDAPLIFEWMQDPAVTRYLPDDWVGSSMEDVLRFVQNASQEPENRYFAIVNEEDAYIGTSGLRDIDFVNGTAEFSLVIRRGYWTKGYAWEGLVDTFQTAFEKLDLERIYWCVPEENQAALRFFRKHGFNTLDEDVPKEILARHEEETSLVWFAVLKGDDYVNEALSRGTVAGCPIIRIKTVPTIEAGELSFFEANQDVAFDIKRIYYISKVPEGVRRGFHAHRQLKQLLFCPYGKIQLVLENERGREEITLHDPSIGVVIDKPIWREMLWLQKDSVLCVAASDYYDPADYIRSYEEFRSLMREKN